MVPRNHDAPIEYRQARFQAPAGACELLLVRHGESEPARPHVPFPLVDGQSDPGLAPEGREHAERVAGRLGAQRIDAIYVTSLRRTHQTAAPLATRLGLTPRVEPELREVHLGEWEGGLYRKMLAENHPVTRTLRAEERWDVIPGAETGTAFESRVRTAVERLAAAHPDGRIAVVTHGGVIGQALAIASGSRPFAFVGADNGSISQVVVGTAGWVVRGFNDTTHLDPTFSTTDLRHH